MGVYQRDGRYMVYWQENGKRHDKSFGRGDDARLRAEGFDLVIQQAKADGIAPVQVAPVIETVAGPVLDAHNAAPAIDSVVPVAAAPAAAPAVAQVMPSPVAGITFGQLSMMYLDHLRVSGRTEKHIASLENLLKRMFFDILGKDTPVAGMTYLKDIVPFIRQMQGVSEQTGKPRSQASVNRYCDYIDAIFNFGMEMELISKSPMKGRKKAKEQPRDVQVSVDDIRRIMDHAEPHIRWAMEACFNLGTRADFGEIGHPIRNIRPPRMS